MINHVILKGRFTTLKAYDHFVRTYKDKIWKKQPDL